MKTSDTIGQIAKALSAAQGEFTNPERNRTVSVKMKNGGSYTFDYATFDAILALTRPILARHGLAVVQGVSTDGNKVTVTTRVAHASGEWYEDSITGTAESGDIQAIGSTCTYLKRYSYTAMLNIAAEEDDDGVAASGHDADKFDRKDLPNCPKCSTNKSVIVGKPEYGGGFVCFGKKGGCGEKWSDQPPADPPPSDKPARKGTAKQQADKLAAEHGMKTGDQLPTADELDQINEYQQLIAGATDLDQLKTISDTLKNKSQAVKDKVRPLYAAKQGVLKGQAA